MSALAEGCRGEEPINEDLVRAYRIYENPKILADSIMARVDQVGRSRSLVSLGSLPIMVDGKIFFKVFWANWGNNKDQAFVIKALNALNDYPEGIRDINDLRDRQLLINLIGSYH